MGKIAIFDDRIEEAERLKRALKKYLGDETIYIKNNFDHKFLETNTIDLLFLDIELDSQNGIEEAFKLRLQKASNINIIFFTNYDTYMQNSFIVKPIYFIRKEHLEEDLEKAWEILELNNFRLRRILPNNINIPINKIMYVASNGHYINLYLENGKMIKERKKLDEIEKEVIQETFIRCHKSYIVNFRNVDTKENDKFRMNNGTYIKISRKYYKKVDKKWDEYKRAIK